MQHCLTVCSLQMCRQPVLLRIATQPVELVENSLESPASSSIIDNALSLRHYPDGKPKRRCQAAKMRAVDKICNFTTMSCSESSFDAPSARLEGIAISSKLKQQ